MLKPLSQLALGPNGSLPLRSFAEMSSYMLEIGDLHID